MVGQVGSTLCGHESEPGTQARPREGGRPGRSTAGPACLSPVRTPVLQRKCNRPARRSPSAAWSAQGTGLLNRERSPITKVPAWPRPLMSWSRRRDPAFGSGRSPSAFSPAQRASQSNAWNSC